MKNIFKKPSLLFLIPLISIIFSSCGFINSFKADGEKETEKENSAIEITSLTLSKQSVNLSVGEMAYIMVNVKPQNKQKGLELNWRYDDSIIEADTSSPWGITITGLKEGQTNLICSYDGYESSCIIKVSGYSENYKETTEPYIYSSTTIIQTSPGATEKVYCSLFGGSAADLDGYTWTIDDAAVASITPMGQYCMITAKDSGYARIKVTHQKAAYPYYIGVYVFADVTKLTYITTTNNILTMKTGEESQTISVSLVNGSKNLNDYKWEIKNEDKKEDKEEVKENNPISCEFNGNKAVITPKKSGSCTLRVTHPEAKYPLDILCRVVSIVNNVYIEPDKTVVTLSGDSEESVTSTLKNISFGQYDIDSFEYELSDYDVAEITGWAGDKVLLKGKQNGSCNLIISHPDSKYTREILLIVNGQAVDSLDSSIYITTSQNYIRTKVGADETCITITLKGGEEGEQSDFTWSIKSTPKDEGNESDVVSMITTDGNVNYSRMASTNYILGKAYITPKCEGTAVITISHEKAIYPCEILVKVLNQNAILDEPLYFAGSGIIRMLNGSSSEYTVSLKGTGKTTEDDNNIKWSCENKDITISSSANNAVISAPPLGTGNTVSNLVISHNKAEADKKVLILTADTEEELNNMNALYSEKNYYNLNIGDTTYCMTNYVGFDTYETTIDNDGNEIQEKQDFDFSAAIWTCSDENVCEIKKIDNNPLNCEVTALKAGTATVTITVRDNNSKIHKCEYSITVYPEDAVQTKPEVYFTTTNNVVNLRAKDSSAGVYISAVNLNYYEYDNIVWTCEDSSVCTVADSGTYAKITAVSEGKTVIRVSHPDSQNTLKIYVNVGKEYVASSDSSAYIKASNLITLKKGDKATLLNATLANYSGIDTSGFRFHSDDESIAKISAQSDNGTAYIKPISVGYTEIKISHTATDITKKVLVIVEKDEEAINTALSKNIYLTTSKNVVDFSEPGQSQSVRINAVNLSEEKYQSIIWTSSDESVVTVVSNGTNATLRSEGEGSAYVYASYSDSINTLRFNVYVGAAAISGNGNGNGNSTSNGSSGGSGSGNGGTSSGNSGSSSNPGGSGNNNSSSQNGNNGTSISSAFISSVNVLSVLKTEDSAKLTAALANYSGTDTSGFSFSIADTKIAKIATQSTNGTAYIQPVSSGYTEVTISHTATDVTKKVIVVVSENEAAAVQELNSRIYLTTSKNVVDFKNKGLSETVRITAVNVPSYDFASITWTSSDESVVTVVPNGTSATLRSEGEGIAYIYAQYPESTNIIRFNVYVGAAAISSNGNGNSNGNNSSGGNNSGNGGSGTGNSGGNTESGNSGSGSGNSQNDDPENTLVSAFISSVNVLTVLKTDNSTKLTATLANYSGADTSGFSFNIADNKIAKIDYQSTNGIAYIKPVSTGYTEVTISHTATDVTKKVIVVVSENEAAAVQELNSKIYLTTSKNVVDFKEKGLSENVRINAINLKESNYSSITWTSSDESVVTVIPNGTSATLRSTGEGSAFVYASYSGSLNTIRFNIYVGAAAISGNGNSNSNGNGSSGGNNSGGNGNQQQGSDPDTLVSAYISSVNVLSILKSEGSAKLTATLANYNGTDNSGFSFSIADSGIAKILSQSINGTAYVKYVSSGYTEITITHTKTDAAKKVLVVTGENEEEIAQILASKVYFTTSKNVVDFSEAGKSQSVKINAVNLAETKHSSIVWTSTDESVVTVVSNGTSATLRSEGEGTAYVYVTHPDSINTIRFNVYVGAAAISGNGNGNSNGNNNSGGNSSGTGGGSSSGSSQNGNSSNTGTSAYISSVNVLTVLKTDESTKLTATLANYSGTDTSGFSFSIADTSKARIATQSTNGTAYVKYVSSGYTEITINHIVTDVTKKVLVVTGENEDEITQILASIVYLTASRNVIDFDRSGLSETVRITAINLPESDYQSITWTSSDESVVTVIPNGTSATLRSEGEGTAYVYVAHPNSINTLRFNVYVGAAAISGNGNGNSNGNNNSGGNSSGTGGGSSSGSSQSGNSSSMNSAYISSVNVLTVLKSEERTKLTATLANYNGVDTSGFSFSIADTSKARIDYQSTNGTAYIKPVSTGYTEVTISHTATDVTKKVIVVVSENAVEAIQTLEKEKYLTTTNNTVFIDEPGERTNIKVTANNFDSLSSTGIRWVSSDPTTVRVIGNGTSAVFIGLKAGNTTVSCSHTNSRNSITFYVYVGEKTETINATTQQIQPVVYISTKDIITLVNGGSTEELRAVLVNYSGADTSGFSFSIDNSNVAEIVNQFTSGIAFIKPKQAGQAEITISHPQSNIDRKVPVIVGNSEEELAKTTYLTTSSNVVSIGEGKTRTVSVNVRNTDDVILDGYTWESSDDNIVSIIQQGSTAVFTGNSEGTAIVTVENSYCTYPLQIIVQCVNPITAAANPYVQLSSSVLTLTVSSTYTSITADLVGGTDEDKKGFVWTSSDSSICSCYGQNEVGKIRALKEGTTYITVTHPKASGRSAQILVICEQAVQKDCYISVPVNIISMKPTDGSKTITASLINGTANDKYDFTWNIDKYDVVDFVPSANTCMITPLQVGEATITIRHHKAMPQQIVVKVQEYTTFAFPNDYITLTNGQVYFADMQIPTTKVKTFVEYSTANSNICTIDGSKNTAQIIATGAGTTTVKAELKSVMIENNEEVITKQASAEMMVYVKESAVNTCYITAAKSIHNIKKGNSTTLQVSITGSGIETDDLQNFRWETSDTTLISIAGAKQDEDDKDEDGNRNEMCVYGQSVYITAKAGGEAVITVSHPKAASNWQFLIIIPDEVEKNVMLNKNHIQLVKGGGGTTLLATIENYESNNDYNSLVWNVTTKGDGTEEVCRITGLIKNDIITGKEITIYPLNIGNATIKVGLPNGKSATCEVVVEAGKSFTFENTAVRCAPGETKKIKYKVSPPNAHLDWTPNQAGDFFTYTDLHVQNPTTGEGYVQVTGMNVGSGNLYCVTDGNAKGNLSVDISWDYKFLLTGRTTFSIKPGATATVNYRVNPVDAEIFVDDAINLNKVYKFEQIKNDKNDGTGKLVFTGLGESDGQLSIDIKAQNPNDDGYIFKTQTVKGIISYDVLTLNTTLTNDYGKWSKYSEDSDTHTGTLVIGDGEKVKMTFSIAEQNVNAYIESVKFEKAQEQNLMLTTTRIGSGSTPTTVTYSFQHPNDYLEYQYRIISYKIPQYNKNPYMVTTGSGQGTKVNYPEPEWAEIPNWQNSFYWYVYTYVTWPAKNKDDYFGLCSQYSSPTGYAQSGTTYNQESSAGWVYTYYDEGIANTNPTFNEKNYRRVEGKALKGKIYTVEEFRKIAWFYCPGTPRINSKEDEGEIVRYPVSNQGAFGNIGSYCINVSGYEIKDNVDAAYEPVTDMTQKGAAKDIGQIIVTVVHHKNGKDIRTDYAFPVICETRPCQCTYKK